jgi:hypothetical protein
MVAFEIALIPTVPGRAFGRFVDDIRGAGKRDGQSTWMSGVEIGGLVEDTRVGFSGLETGGRHAARRAW